MSSAEAFALMMRSLPHVTLVGATTRGASGNPQPFELKTLDATVVYSRWVAMESDGAVFEGQGIEPEVLVEFPPEQYADADPTFDEAVKVLRKHADAEQSPAGSSQSFD